MGVKRWLSARTQAAASAIAIAVGVVFAILPQDWIEERFGIDPDAGSGSIERLLVGVPLAIGAALAVSAIVSFLRRQFHRSSVSRRTAWYGRTATRGLAGASVLAERNGELRVVFAKVVNREPYHLPRGGHDVSMNIFLEFDG
jgi:drug/metabolite transporter (DMT)-like permease